MSAVITLVLLMAPFAGIGALVFFLTIVIGAHRSQK